MFTTRMLTVATVLAAGALTGAVALARSRAPEPVPAPRAAEDKPVAPAELIIGRWQGEGKTATTYNEKKDPASAKKYVEKVVIEFRKDGTFKIEGAGIPEVKSPAWKETGTYKFVSETEVETVMDSRKDKIEQRTDKVTVTKDELVLTEKELVYTGLDGETVKDALGDNARTTTYKRVK